MQIERKNKTGWLLALLVCLGVLLSGIGLYSCHRTRAVSAEVSEDREDASEESLEEAAEEEVDLLALAQGDIDIRPGALKDFAHNMDLHYERESGQLVYTLTLPQIPKSDDAYLYLFERACYEEENGFHGEPAAKKLKGTTCELSFPYEKKYLFEKLIPALLINGQYVPVGKGTFLSNPEALAENQEEYPNLGSKKGLLLDPTMFGTEYLTDLGVKHAIYNMPLSLILGETTDETAPTIRYPYEGKEYLFNGAAIRGYDNLFVYLEELGMSATVVILNDWNEEHLELIHPEARNHLKTAYYYMFNGAEEEGVREIEAIASFLAERYCGGEHGIIHNWVIANEINQSKSWNYMDTEDVAYYAREFEKTFRIFYQAAKSHYANARVYFSIDHDWNSNQGQNEKYFNSREVLAAFKDAAAEYGNYNWGIAIHPYPSPLTRVNYWSIDYDKTQDTPYLTVMNLGVLTDVLQQEEYLDTNGEVRSVTITELGFSSRSGEKLQAAAYAYCYYIVEDNPYIDAFILNRQTDAPEEVAQGLAFGIYEYDHTEKYLKDVFRCIDTEEADKYTDFMLNILGADNLEEALSWAK